MSGIVIVSAGWYGEYHDRIVALRYEVYVDEQKVPQILEIDDYDPVAVHLVALDGEQVVGTLRIVDKSPTVKIGRVAVKKSHRYRGIARDLMLRSHEISRELGASRIELDSQLTVIPFYEKLGYEAYGDVFDDAGIDHKKMELFLK